MHMIIFLVSGTSISIKRDSENEKVHVGTSIDSISQKSSYTERTNEPMNNNNIGASRRDAK